MDNISDSIIQKAQIISKLNTGTNFSLRIAAKHYNDKNYTESSELLEKHLEKFPTSNVAQILLSKTYAQLGKYHQAVQLLKSANQTIYSPTTFDFYLKEIETIQRKETIDVNSENANTLELKIPEQTNENELTYSGGSDTLGQFLISETLAKIYISQGEVKEAISIYEKLIERKPENKEEYSRAIEELKSRLEK